MKQWNCQKASGVVTALTLNGAKGYLDVNQTGQIVTIIRLDLGKLKGK